MATTRRRKVENEREALALLDELAHSGLELSAFCASRGVDGRSLNCWRRNLGSRLPSQALRLVEVVATEVEEAPAAAYMLRIGEVYIEVDDHFRDATLVRLLRVAAAC